MSPATEYERARAAYDAAKNTALEPAARAALKLTVASTFLPGYCQPPALITPAKK